MTFVYQFNHRKNVQIKVKEVLASTSEPQFLLHIYFQFFLFFPYLFNSDCWFFYLWILPLPITWWSQNNCINQHSFSTKKQVGKRKAFDTIEFNLSTLSTCFRNITLKRLHIYRNVCVYLNGKKEGNLRTSIPFNLNGNTGKKS